MMSDIPSSVLEIAATAQTTSQSSGSIWPYVIGGIAAVVLCGYAGFKFISRPKFILSQIRKRNLKAMKKEGIEENEASLDLNRLLNAIEQHAEEKKLTSADTIKLIMPLNDQNKMTSAKEMYLTLQQIAKEVGDTRLANEFKTKSSGVKSSSKLMVGLLKRAGI